MTTLSIQDHSAGNYTIHTGGSAITGAVFGAMPMAAVTPSSWTGKNGRSGICRKSINGINWLMPSLKRSADPCPR